MLRRSIVAGVLLAGFGAAQAQCACGGTSVARTLVVSTLAGKTVCGAVDGDRFQEFHSGSTAAGGPLIDYKRGPNHPVDPTEQVGTWSVVGVDSARAGPRVIHNYGSGGTFEYELCQAGTQYNFCRSARNGRDVVGTTLLAGQVACP